MPNEITKISPRELAATLGRAALNVVLNDLEAVHEMNHGIGEKARVPLPDQPNVSESYEHLLKLEELGGADHKYLPSDASRMYTVRELLEGESSPSKNGGASAPRASRKPPRLSTAWASSPSTWSSSWKACWADSAPCCHAEEKFVFN